MGTYGFNSVNNPGNGYNFNIINSKCNAITGRERKNRKSLVCLSTFPGGDRIATQYTKVFHYADQKMGLSRKFSRGFEHGMCTGLCIGEMTLNRSEDVYNGEIDLDIHEYNAFIADYTCRDIWGFSDCKYMWFMAYKDKYTMMASYPEAADIISTMSTAAYGNNTFYFLPEAQTARQINSVSVSRFWQQVPYEKKVYISFAESAIKGKTFHEGQLPDEVLNMPQLRFESFNVPAMRWKLTVVINDKIVQEELDPLKIDDCPFLAFTWDYNPEIQSPQFRVRGYPDPMLSQQMLINRTIIKNHNILESSINAGLHLEENQLVDEDVAMKGGEGLNIVRKYGTPPPQQIQPVSIPQSNFSLIDYLKASAEEASTAKPILDGSDKESTSGLMQMVRQDAADTPLQKYWDNVDLSRERMGYLMLKISSANWTAQKFAEVTNAEHWQECAGLVGIYSGDYKIVIEEAQNSTSQKRSEFVTLSEVCAVLGVKMPIALGLRKAPVQGVEELIAALQQESEADKEAQTQKLSLELALVEAEIKKVNAQALEQMNLAKSHHARAGSYQGLEHERNAEVSKNESVASKNNAESLLKIMPLIDQYGLDKVKELLLLLHTDDSSIQQLEGPHGTPDTSLQQSTMGPSGVGPLQDIQEENPNGQVDGAVGALS
jgi:hypothetical protein